MFLSDLEVVGDEVGGALRAVHLVQLALVNVSVI